MMLTNISTSQFQWNAEKILCMFIELANDRTKIQILAWQQSPGDFY